MQWQGDIALIQGKFQVSCAGCLVQDESVEIAGGAPATPEDGLSYLAQHCQVAVVTLGEKGCMVKEHGSEEVILEPACSGVKVGRAA